MKALVEPWFNKYIDAVALNYQRMSESFMFKRGKNNHQLGKGKGIDKGKCLNEQFKEGVSELFSVYSASHYSPF